eukprot:evm.model.scf_340.7 EVM.evm.TU.scf_340.7   scf_340:47458-50619(+)
MQAGDAQVAAGHSLDLQDVPTAADVQSMREDALLTTVLMEHGHPVEGDPMSQPLDAGMHQSEAYALKSSPDDGYGGYGFKNGQDMMLPAELAGVAMDQPVELVPIQVVPSQGGMMASEAFSPNGYMDGSGYAMANSQSKPMQQGGQFSGQRFVSKGSSDTSLRGVGHTPTRVDANGRPTKMLVHRARSAGGAQAGLGLYRSVARVSRTMSDSDIVLESPLGGQMGSGQMGHSVFHGMGGVVHAGGRMGNHCMTENGDRAAVGGKEGTKTRWKPNPVQLCLLEQHFNSGYTKATPELHAAVQGAGHATENQVTVWLKNRLSRCKRPPPKAKQSDALKVEEEESDNEVPWEDFSKVSATVLEELSSILSTVDKQDIVTLAKSIRSANRIGCCGVGREGLVMRALAASLHHLGFEVYCTGDTNMPPFGANDLMLVSAGPSYYSSVSAIALEAMRAHAVVIAFTAHKTADLPFAEHVIRIAAQTLPPSMPVMNQNLSGTGTDLMSFLPEGRVSILQMGASYEMSMWLMFECVSIMLRKACHVSASDMRSRHTNLE